MSRIWKDKIFIACVLVASISGFSLIVKLTQSMKLDTFSSNSSKTNDIKSNVTTTSAPSLTMRSGFMNKAPAMKVRPKAGGNEWSVGSGPEFDSTDLDTVISNTLPGDKVRISPGIYQFSMNKAFKNLHLIGEEGVIFEIRNNDPHLPYYNSLQIEKVHIRFLELAQSGYLYLNESSQLILKQSKIDASHFYFSLNDNTKMEVHETKLVGVSFRLNDSSSLTLEDSSLEKEDKFIMMSDFSSLKMNRSHLTRFSDSAIYNFSRHTSLKAYDIKIDNGDHAFGGSEMDSNDVSHSSFSKLQSLTTSKIKINCTMCEMSDIQR
jgi:hypothetical protein